MTSYADFPVLFGKVSSAKNIHDGIVADCAALAAASKLPGGTPSDSSIWELARAGAVGNPTGAYCVLTQPSTQLTLSIALKGSGLCSVNWGDGTAIQSIALNPTNATTVAGTWGVGANMTVLVAGRITSFVNTTGAIGGIVSGLRSTLTSLTIQGSNTCSGSVAGLTSLTSLTIQGSNTCSGSVAGLTSLTLLQLQGYNTCTGSVAGLTLLTYLSVTGNNTCTYNTAGGSRSWASGLTQIYIRPGSAGVFTSAMVDAIAIDSSGTTWASPKTFDCRGNCGAPTATSLTARTVTLPGLGVTVSTN
jgi:hypothetical protein